MKEKINNKKIKSKKITSGLSSILNFRYLNRLISLFKIEYKNYGWYIILLGVLSFVSGILEGFGVTAIIPLFSFLDQGKTESTDVISQFIENFFALFHLPFNLNFLLLFILVVFVVKAAVLFLVNHISAHITTTYEKETRSELFHATLKSNWPYLSKQKVGYLNQILNVDVTNSSAMLTYISMFMMTIINLIIYSFLAFNVSKSIAVFTVLFGVVIFFVFKPILYKNKVLSQELSQLQKDLAHYVDEVILGVKAVKSMFLEKEISKWGDKSFDQVRKLNMRMTVLRNLTNALLQPLGMLLIVVIFAYFYSAVSFSFASFAVIVYAINKVFANIQIVQAQLHKISSFEPYLTAIVNYKNNSFGNKEIDEGNKTFSFKDKMEFKDIRFAYNNEKDVLGGISFTIKKGEMIGIIGPSGSGKTTLTDLILRLFKPNSGKIFIDSKEIADIKLSEWRKKIGYVSQDAFLVNDTIENNIRFHNEKVSHNDIVRAAKMANIYDFINELPDKFETIVGERGMILSGGQRQRIILARVLATNPEILILDEATSALDNESEALIHKAIDDFKGKVTVIAIAHRISTIMSADSIISLIDGKIVEKGVPQDLLKNNNSYLYKVYNLKQ